MKFNLLYFIRLFLKHLHLLILIPVLLAGTVTYLTQNPVNIYYSTAKIYTGIASGTTLELDSKGLSYQAANTAFDNLMNIIKSRRTLGEVGLRLFAQHMSLEAPDPMIISSQKYNDLMKIVPQEIKDLTQPGDYKGNLERYRAIMEQSTDNFFYELLNYTHPVYSIDKISSRMWVKRVFNSDFIEIGYELDDPGICQNTLRFLAESFILFNTELKINNSDGVVRYFESQLQKASGTLRAAEGNMLEFNQEYNVINYYEQTKHIASRREHTELEYQTVLTNHYGAKAILRNLESRLQLRQQQRLNSQSILEVRDRISDVRFQMTMLELTPPEDSSMLEQNAQDFERFQREADSLEQVLSHQLDTLYEADMDPNGLPATSILDDWLTTVMEVDRTGAQIMVYEEKRKEFEELYGLYAPLGAEMKRLERKIDVAEREYLSILHNLGQAKLKQQSIEMGSNYTIAEPPFYPILPKPNKRKLLIAAAGVMGFALTAFTILLLDFLDTNIRNEKRATEKTGLPVTAIYPKLVRKSRRIDVDYLKSRATDAILLNVAFADRTQERNLEAPSVNFFISTQQNDGKSYIGHQLLSKLGEMGYRALFLSPQKGDQEFSAAEYDWIEYPYNSKIYAVERLSELHRDLTPERLQDYDFIFVEAPPIISKAFPVRLFHEADHIYLVVRANRAWSDADKNALETFREIAPEPEPSIILNGVELQEMESVLGDLPRRRTWVRRFFKNIVRLRFFSKRKL